MALGKLCSRVAPSGPLLGAAAGAATGNPILGGIASSAPRLIGNLINTDESDESLQQDVATALETSSRRFLVVIDDIDRLSPDEALVIFRLVKSVGRLPNVIYLLAYDRITTEKAVKRRYPSEGIHYLEKIVQADFDLPEANQHELTRMLECQIAEILGDVESDSQVHLGNVLYSVVAPEIRTPRDVLRLSNALEVAYPAVRGEVDPTDFGNLMGITQNPNLGCQSHRTATKGAEPGPRPCRFDGHSTTGRRAAEPKRSPSGPFPAICRKMRRAPSRRRHRTLKGLQDCSSSFRPMVSHVDARSATRHTFRRF